MEKTIAICATERCLFNGVPSELEGHFDAVICGECNTPIVNITYVTE